MKKMMKANSRARWLIIFMALCLIAILGASLAQRFKNPHLTINKFAGAQREEAGSQVPPEGMGAIGQLMREAAEHPKDKTILLRLVESLMAIGQWQSAENFVQKALDLNPENPDSRALYLLALARHNQGQHAQAAEILEKLLEKTENPSARYSLAILCIHYLHKPAEGIEQLRKGLAAQDAPPALRAAMEDELKKAAAANRAPAESTGQANEAHPENAPDGDAPSPGDNAALPAN